MKTIARTLLTVIIVAAACVSGYELWDYYMRSPWTRDARVQADVVTIAPDVSGFVDELRVKDNQLVRKGDLLFVLDRERYQRALVTAEANVAARKADMDNARQQAERRARLTNLSVSSVTGKQNQPGKQAGEKSNPNQRRMPDEAIEAERRRDPVDHQEQRNGR